jgi:large subunit ribosomal protein L29
MRANEFRVLGDAELLAKEQELRKNLFSLGIQHSTGQLNNTALLTKTKRDLARLLGVISERKIKGKK